MKIEETGEKHKNIQMVKINAVEKERRQNTQNDEWDFEQNTAGDNKAFFSKKRHAGKFGNSNGKEQKTYEPVFISEQIKKQTCVPQYFYEQIHIMKACIKKRSRTPPDQISDGWI